tara:strand:- start:657 stop:1187 length:531 start_codon:yes stop_codon:yes gene_type:complete
MFPESPNTWIVGNPLEDVIGSGIGIQHIIGHILWGSIIGLGTLSIRYIILGGGFALLLDADHLLQFLDIEMVVRMSHSIPFAIIGVIVFYFISRGKELKTCAVAFAAVLSHIAFDIFLSDIAFNGDHSAFPLLSPFLLDGFTFKGYDWFIFEVIGVLIVAIVSYVSIKKEKITKIE